MALVVKVCAAGLLAAIAGLMIKRANAEMSVALSACCVAVILLCVIGYAESLGELAELAAAVIASADRYVRPVLKCLGIAIVTRFASQLCKDTSQGAIAASIEFAGVLCALCVSMPLLVSVLKMLGGLV